MTVAEFRSGSSAIPRTGGSCNGTTTHVAWSTDKAVMGANGAKRPWTISNGTSTTTLSAYDPVGRVMASSQTTQTTQGAPQAYSSGYTYNLAGAMTSETYPSGRVITTGYDAANRAAWLQGALGSVTTNYVGGPSSANWIQYTPHGVPWNFTRKNGLTYTADYNARLQLVQAYESLGNANTAAAMLLLSCPQWGSGGPASQPVKICPASTQGSNNGNLAGYLEFLGGPGNAASPFVPSSPTFHLTSVNYDNVNRLTGISDSGGWSRSFVYDQWGNMAVSGASGTGTLNLNTPQGNSATISSLYNASNELVMSGVGYDLAGNMNALNTFSGVKYDAENRLTNESSPGPFVYQYDGSGRRVTKTGGGNTTVYVYDAAGELAAEYDTAAQAALCATCYLSTDHLGSVRLVTDGSGNVVSRHDYLPFGEEITDGYAGRTAALGFVGSEGVTQRFTGKERDAESGLDYFGARYYGSALGRFTSPDPLMASPERLLDPQEWNMYAYVRNNPLNNTDPTGLDIWLQGCGKDSSTCQSNYVGTTDKDGNFTRTHLTGDQTANATIGENGISLTQDGKTYQGVWDRNVGEQGAVLVSGAGDLKSFNANLTGACQNTCVASGVLQNKDGSPATAGDLRNALQGKSDWFANNNDPFHRHDGKNDTSFNADPPGPAGQRSTDVTVPQRGNSLDSRFHVNSGYPFQDAYQMTRHVISIMNTFTNAVGLTHPTTTQ